MSGADSGIEERAHVRANMMGGQFSQQKKLQKKQELLIMKPTGEGCRKEYMKNRRLAIVARRQSMEQTVAGLTETNAALAQTVSALQNEAELLRMDLQKSGVLVNLPRATVQNDPEEDVKPSLASLQAASGWTSSSAPSLSPSPPPPPPHEFTNPLAFNNVVNL